MPGIVVDIYLCNFCYNIIQNMKLVDVQKNIFQTAIFYYLHKQTSNCQLCFLLDYVYERLCISHAALKVMFDCKSCIWNYSQVIWSDNIFIKYNFNIYDIWQPIRLEHTLVFFSTKTRPWSSRSRMYRYCCNQLPPSANNCLLRGFIRHNIPFLIFHIYHYVKVSVTA
jgi:hypothetical protein